MKRYYGFYSKLADEDGVTLNLYRTPSGYALLTTRVDCNPELSPIWPDEKCLGEVTEWVRVQRVDPRQLIG